MTEYYKKIHLKTAVFLASCCQLGGIVAKLTEREVLSLTNYGIGLGLAFQIIDDLLDFFGEPSVTGKALGGDLKSGVITLPVLRALSVSNQSKVLKENVTDLDIKTAINIIKQTDSLEYCKLRAYAHIDSARINLSPSINDSTNFVLEKIADFVVDRTW